MERAGRVELRDHQLGRLLRAPCASRPAFGHGYRIRTCVSWVATSGLASRPSHESLEPMARIRTCDPSLTGGTLCLLSYIGNHGGRGRIRTHAGRFAAHLGFQDRSHKPLAHSSMFKGWLQFHPHLPSGQQPPEAPPLLVGDQGFEPWTSCSQGRRATRLR
jgi:hypothetical protein